MAEIEVARTLLNDIKEFISEKWTHSECELCGTDRWMTYPEPSTHAFLPVGDERGPPTTAYYAQPMVAYLPVSCINCGNLRLIDARTFEKWREAREQRTTKSSL